MNKAFLFDMDGVLIDSEKRWAVAEHQILPQLFGEKISANLGRTIGLNIHDIYDTAITMGGATPKEDFIRAYEEAADIVYAEAVVTEGIDSLVQYLRLHDFRIGLVSMSRERWINLALAKIPCRDAFEVIISLDDHPELKSKPSPDGYRRAMEVLGAEPARSIVLEDSIGGILSGKNAGAFTIGFREHLFQGYKQTGADVYSNSMNEVITLVEQFDTSLNS